MLEDEDEASNHCHGFMLEKCVKISIVETDIGFVLWFHSTSYNNAVSSRPAIHSRTRHTHHRMHLNGVCMINNCNNFAGLCMSHPSRQPILQYQDLTFVRRDLLVERDLRFPAQAPWTGLLPSSRGSRICLRCCD